MPTAPGFVYKLHGWNLRHVILPVGDRFFGQRMMQRLAFLQKAQWWNRERILQTRNHYLRQLMHQAYEVPFYRDLLDERGLKPTDIQTASDLHKLPVVTKAMLRPETPHRTTRSTGQNTYDECSSGSTGEPFCVREDAYTAGWYRASFMLALHWAGWRLGEPHLQTGMSLARQRGRKIKDQLLLCHYKSAYNLTDAHLDHMLDTLHQHELEHLWGYPGSLYQLAERALNQGRSLPLRSIITWGDMLYPQYREVIQQAFSAKITDTYGCAEGIQIAAQCEGSDHYLIHSLDVIVEFLDDNDQPVPPGTPGNLILTRLHAGPTPLIRYRVGDVAISGGERLSPDGRGFEILEHIQGRDTDIIITPGGNRLIVHFFTGILEHYKEVDAFQVIQEDSDHIILKIVPTPGFTDDIAHHIIKTLQGRGADIAIHIDIVDEIPLTNAGKRRFVINRLNSSNSISPTQR